MVKKVVAIAMAIASTFTLAGAQAKAPIIDGNVAKQNIDKVNSSVYWNRSLAQAQEQARRENKMILWVQMIGQMSGST